MEVLKSDVLVIGSGGAGLRAAIELHDNKIDVLVVGKCKKRDAHTILATGGINAALANMDKEDNWRIHAADTIKDGGMINDPDGVQLLCKNAPRAIKELTKFGAKFHREKGGRISQRFFGAAAYRRACFVGDQTGKEILNVLVEQINKKGIKFKSEVYIFSLLRNKDKINGALGLSMKTGKIILFHAKTIVLAAGGHSRMFQRSSSRAWENNGDGIKLAYDCGAHLMDMEMFQFHPTGMMAPKEAEGILVTEAVRGEGGRLTNSKGERFMEKYDTKRMELSARDIVARAIYTEVKEGRGTRNGGVWLDITHRKKSYIRERLPKVYKQFKEYLGIDISKNKMEVAPTAHYSMGGILVDHKTGKTTVDRLYAIGEVTAGIHGGNRLGGNSLAEILVFGRLTGKQAAKDVKKINGFVPIDSRYVKQKKGEFLGIASEKGENPIELKKKIQKLMWENAGVVRDVEGLKKASREIGKYETLKFNTGKRLRMNSKLIAALDVLNMIPACKMIIESALMRKESRAAHYREDYPKISKKWKKNIICIPYKKSFKLKTRDVPKTPKIISKYFKYKAPDTKAKHMLE